VASCRLHIGGEVEVASDAATNVIGDNVHAEARWCLRIEADTQWHGVEVHDIAVTIAVEDGSRWSRSRRSTLLYSGCSGTTSRWCRAWHGGRHGVTVVGRGVHGHCSAWRGMEGMGHRRGRCGWCWQPSQSRMKMGEGGERRRWRLENGEEQWVAAAAFIHDATRVRRRSGHPRCPCL
jgi:hypothetical protein